MAPFLLLFFSLTREDNPCLAASRYTHPSAVVQMPELGTAVGEIDV